MTERGLNKLLQYLGSFDVTLLDDLTLYRVMLILKDYKIVVTSIVPRM